MTDLELPVAYQAESDAEDLDDGIEFHVVSGMRRFGGRNSINVTFSGGAKRKVLFEGVSDKPPGYSVGVKLHIGDYVHVTLEEIEPIKGTGGRSFRVVVPEKLKADWAGRLRR